MLFSVVSLCDDEESRQFFVDLYLRYRPIMFKIASRYVDSIEVAEDIIHDTMVKLIEKKDLLIAFDGCTLRTYVVYAIRNMSISFIRRRSREKERVTVLDDESYEISKLSDNAPSPEEVVLVNERKSEFIKVWKTLPEDVRELLAGKYILQMSNVELAEEFGCNPDSIRMKLTRARRMALEQFKEGVFELDPT